jgi:hypothetical protein
MKEELVELQTNDNDMGLSNILYPKDKNEVYVKTYIESVIERLKSCREIQLDECYKKLIKLKKELLAEQQQLRGTKPTQSERDNITRMTRKVNSKKNELEQRLEEYRSNGLDTTANHIKFLRITRNCKQMISRLKKLLKIIKTSTFKNNHLSVNEMTIFLLPEKDHHFMELANNVQPLLETLSDQREFQPIDYSPNENIFERRINSLSNETCESVSKFILFGHGDENSVGSINRPRIDRHTLVEIINKRLEGLNLHPRPTLVATECHGHLHKDNYTNISVKAVVNEEFRNAITLENRQVSLELYLLEEYVAENYI